MSSENSTNSGPARSPFEEARDPQTTPDRLRALSRDGGEIAQAVAANPNTPTATLLWLAKDCWEALLVNPVLPLLLLEDPGLPLRLPKPALLALLRLHEPPAEFLQTLHRHEDPEVRDAARLHRNAGAKTDADPLLARLDAVRGAGLAMRELLSVGLVPPWLLRWAMESGAKALRELAWKRADASDDPAIKAHFTLLRWLEWLGTRKPKKEHAHHAAPEKLAALAEGGVFARQLAAKNRATPPEVLARLAGDPMESAVVRRFAAKNPNTPASTLLTLAMTGDKALRAAVLRNPSTPPAALEQLATSPEVDFRLRVAANRSTPSPALARLAQDSDEDVRVAVARNANTDLTSLRGLVSDKEYGVRRALAERRGCPLEILAALCKDPNLMVRFSVTDNANFPDREKNEDKLRWLINKFHGTSRDCSAVPSVLDFPDEEVPASAYASTHDTPPGIDQLRTAAEDDVDLRRAAAGNRATLPEALALLAGDLDEETRRAAAVNPALPASVHERMASDSATWVRACFA